MRRMKRYHLKNRLLLANFISNLIGVLIVFFLLRKLYYPLEAEVLRVSSHVNMVFTPASFLVIAIFTVWYEWPIRRYIDLCCEKAAITADFEMKARKRLLNEPFFLIAVNFSVWMLAGIVFSTLYWRLGMGWDIIQRPIIMNTITGLITLTVAFFVIEHHLQKILAPLFFPEGRLTAVPNTLHIRMGTRLFAVLLACNLIPLAAILSLFSGLSKGMSDPVDLFEKLRFGTYILAFLFMGTSIWLITLVNRNLSVPFKEIIQVLREISKGRLDRRVRVTSNDEIGFTGDVVNEMTEGLRERERMRHSLELAKEIQRNLLPLANPKIKGVDIAGTSVYCDETGGDYYDFMDMHGKNQEEKVVVVIGDVSGHGVSSALLMTTARAFLRLRSSMPGSMSDILCDVNRQWTRDLEGTGQFMTLFYLCLDPVKRKIKWIRAGHDPALFFNPITDTFEELKGKGMVLGVDEDQVFEEQEKNGLAAGQILVLGTDGIWEARNAKGEMFGKEAVRSVVRAQAHSSARKIQEAILGSLERFQGEIVPEDDVTLVVIKILDRE